MKSKSDYRSSNSDDISVRHWISVPTEKRMVTHRVYFGGGRGARILTAFSMTLF